MIAAHVGGAGQGFPCSLLSGTLLGLGSLLSLVFRTEDVWLRCIHWQRAPKVTARRWIRNCVRPKKVKRYIKQIVKRYIKQRLANISTGRLPPERKPVSWRFFLVVVRDFYYNATPKASPKREYGEATRTCVLNGERANLHTAHLPVADEGLWERMLFNVKFTQFSDANQVPRMHNHKKCEFYFTWNNFFFTPSDEVRLPFLVEQLVLQQKLMILLIMYSWERRGSVRRRSEPDEKFWKVSALSYFHYIEDVWEKVSGCLGGVCWGLTISGCLGKI